MILQSFLNVMDSYDRCFLICSGGYYYIDLNDSPFSKESWCGLIRDVPKIYKKRSVLKMFNVPFSNDIFFILG